MRGLFPEFLHCFAVLQDQFSHYFSDRASSLTFANSSSSCFSAGLAAFERVGVALRTEVTPAGAATFIVVVRFTAEEAPIPDSDGRGLAPAAVARAVPDDVGEVTEPRAGGAPGLAAVARVVDVFEASAKEGRADVGPTEGLDAVEDTEGLLLCPGTGATDVRRTRGSDDAVVLPGAVGGFGATEVDDDKGDFFGTAPGVD
jgi:hypothetical protein